jgi:hypothetical protein
MKPAQFLYVFGLSFLLGCQSSLTQDKPARPYAPETEYFLKYLSSLDIEVPPSGHLIYFLFSESACWGCVQRIFLNKMDGSERFIMTRSTANRLSLSDDFPAGVVIFDDPDRINRIKFHGGNVGAVIVRNRAIDTIVVIEPVKMAAQLDFIYHFIQQ